MKAKELQEIQKINELATAMGWTMEMCGENTLFLQQYSPAGEDYGFYVNADSAIADIEEHADSFDPDEHATGLLLAKKESFEGVPTAQELTKDAAEIKEMLLRLSLAVTSGTIPEEKVKIGYTAERLADAVRNLIDWITQGVDDEYAVNDLNGARIDSDLLDELGYHRYAKIMRGEIEADGEDECDE